MQDREMALRCHFFFNKLKTSPKANQLSEMFQCAISLPLQITLPIKQLTPHSQLLAQ